MSKIESGGGTHLKLAKSCVSKMSKKIKEPNSENMLASNVEGGTHPEVALQRSAAISLQFHHHHYQI